MRQVVVESRFFPLLAVLVIMLFFVYPLALEKGEPGVLLTTFMVATFFVSIRAIANHRAMLVLLIVLAIPMFAARIGVGVSDASWLAIAHACISMVLYLLVALVCFSRVVDRSPVNEDKIIGAICVYLLIGVIFAFVYEILYLVDPAAIDLGGVMEFRRNARDFWVFTYFSYVTMTTLGYGDVLPVSLFARSMATLEAILGPLYLAILIARLVSLVGAEPSRKERPTADGGGQARERR